MQLKLYHYWRSSASWRVRWALALKQLPHESIAVNLLKDENLGADYRKKNPAGQVPTLEVDGRPLAESFAILEWLEETHPQPALLPKDPFARAQVREFCLWIVAGTHPLQNTRVIKHLSDQAAEREKWMRHWIQLGLGACETKLAETSGKFAFGNAVTLADICLVPQYYNAIRWKCDLEKLPRCRAVYENCLALDSCKRTAPEAQPEAKEVK